MTNHRTPNRTQHGFTLLEAMTVVLIIAIVAAFAYPSYLEQIRKSKRAVAKSALLEAANREEQYYFSHKAYANALNLLPEYATATVLFDQDGSQPAAAGDAVYALSVFAVNDAAACGTSPCFQLQAVPQNDQVNDSCGTYTLTSSNAKSAAGANCW